MLIAVRIQAEIAPPEYLFDLAEIASKRINTDEPGWQIFYLNLQVARFRANILQGIITNPHPIVEEALRMDGVCSSISLDGVDWTFETVYSDLDLSSDFIILDHYHVYPNFISAQMWNYVRVMRLTLREIIRKTLVQGFSCQPPIFFKIEHAVQFQISTDTLFQLQRELLASIPQYLGFAGITNLRPNWKLPSAQSSLDPKFPWSCFQSTIYQITPTSSPPSNGPPLIRSFGGYILPRLLYVAGNLSITAPTTKQKILKTLRLIGHSMGIQQAFILADEMEGKRVL